jgi:quinohemoprotein ethanol dehydrogenase
MDDDKKWTLIWLTGGFMTVFVALVVTVGLGVLIGHYVINPSNSSTKTVTSSGSSSSGGSSTTSSSTSVEASSTSSAQFAKELQTPTDEWTSVGGSLTHENYSPLDQINKSNVANLKGVWEDNLGTANTAIYSAEGQSIEHDGIEYITTGSDHVFAYEVTSGKLLWEYQPTPAIPLSDASAVCCGWDNRGIGLGDGMVYIGQIDSNLVALDEKTGKVVWTTNLGSAKTKNTITMPITYYNGLVYAGVTGGEYQIRGSMEAFNAKTGKQVWKFWNTAGPGQVNGNTWAGNSALTGGASDWNAPTIDPSSNTMYYSTSNASPDFDGRLRAGKNLYAASIIALNATTGKLKWYYQEVHHDLWDYDATSETVLFNPKINGKTVPAIAEPSKDGMLYVLNRNTGKPLYPTPEKPVVQNVDEKTWPTQPMSPLVFSPQTATPAMVTELEAAAKASSPVAAKVDFTAGSNFDGNAISVGGNSVDVNPNGAAGGDNWEPSSYDEQNNYYYVCSQQSAEAFIDPLKPEALKSYVEQDPTVVAISGFDTPGEVTAFNMNTGKVAWQDKWSQSCYSGTVDTAGGILFVGQNSGKLLALDADTGKTLWSFQTGAGANAPVSVFKVNGTEYVSEYAGGNDLAGASHGANYWLFSLNGKLSQVKAGAAAVAGHHAGVGAPTTSTTASTTTAQSSNTSKPASSSTAGAGTSGTSAITDGKSVFVQNCGGCHTLADAGSAGNEGPNLDNLKPTEAIVAHQVEVGGGAMPAFGKTKLLTATQVTDVAKYVASVAGKK